MEIKQPIFSIYNRMPEIERLANLYTDRLHYNLPYYNRNKEAMNQLLLEFAAEIKRSEKP